MVYTSEKKELWRYASRNNAICLAGDGNNQSQQLHRHQHLHRLQSSPLDYYATTTTRSTIQQPPLSCAATPTNTNVMITSPLTDDRLNQIQQHQQQLEEQDMPPPPYSSVPCGIDCSDACQQQEQQQQLQQQSRMSMSSNHGTDVVGYGLVDGGSMEFGGSVDRYSIGGMSYIDGKSALTCASASSRSIVSISSNNNLERNEEHDCYYNNHNNNNNNKCKKNRMYEVNEMNVVAQQDQLSKRTTQTSTTTSSLSSSTTTTIPIVTSTASVLAATAVSIFRNCCGGGSGSGSGSVEGETSGTMGRRGGGVENLKDSSLTAIMCSNKNNKKSNNKHISILAKKCNAITATTTANLCPPQPYFDAFMKQLKENQMTILLKAVKSRLDPVNWPQKRSQHYDNNQHHHNNHHHHQQQQQQQNAANCCILIYRGLILNEEPHVIACRLFFWKYLKDGNELKRLPDCPSACDPVYICCNPLHWCRIFKAGMS